MNMLIRPVLSSMPRERGPRKADTAPYSQFGTVKKKKFKKTFNFEIILDLQKSLQIPIYTSPSLSSC